MMSSAAVAVKVMLLAVVAGMRADAASQTCTADLVRGCTQNAFTPIFDLSAVLAGIPGSVMDSQQVAQFACSNVTAAQKCVSDLVNGVCAGNSEVKSLTKNFNIVKFGWYNLLNIGTSFCPGACSFTVDQITSLASCVNITAQTQSCKGNPICTCDQITACIEKHPCKNSALLASSFIISSRMLGCGAAA